MKPVKDLIEAIAEKVVNMGGKIEQVHGDAAKRLDDVGKIGAFLRFKT